MIDTLRFANRLKRAGFSDQQSEAFAEAWAEQARDDLPSRADIIALDGKIDRLDAKVDRIHADLDGKIDRVYTDLNGKIDHNHTELDGKIDRVKAELDGKLDKLTWMVGFTLAGVAAVIARLLFVGT